MKLSHEPCHFCKSKVNRRDKIDDQVKQSYRARCYSHPEGPVSKYSRTKPTIHITKRKIGGPNHLCIRQMRLWKSHASALVPAARSSCWLRPGKRAPLSGAAKSGICKAVAAQAPIRVGQAAATQLIIVCQHSDKPLMPRNRVANLAGSLSAGMGL